MELIYLIPFTSFILIQIGEWFLPSMKQHQAYQPVDWMLNVIGLFIQGVIVPVLGMILGLYVYPFCVPQLQGTLAAGWIGGFLLNFVVVDALYYWQHRALHQSVFLWEIHLCHHSSPKLNIWATSRNNLWVNLIFVYLWVNPVLVFLCNQPQGFIFGAMLTASLDILRHSQIDFSWISKAKWYSGWRQIFVTPLMHRSHHDSAKPAHNFGANLIIWDKLFGTYQEPCDNIMAYQPQRATSTEQQFWYPLAKDKVVYAPTSQTKSS